MQIDWLTVTAQAVNFLILVLLLQRLLFGPIGRAMDRREQNIARRLAEAAEKATHAEEQAAEYQLRIVQFEEQRARRIAEMQQEVEEERARLLERARTEVEALSRRWRSELARQREAMRGQIRQTVGQQVVAIARKAVEDLADTGLEERMVDAFLKRLRGLPAEEKQALADAPGDDLTIASGHPLDASRRARLAEALRTELGPRTHLRFEQAADLRCGIALCGAGRRLEWSVDQYFDELEAGIAAALEAAADEPEHARSAAG